MHRFLSTKAYYLEKSEIVGGRFLEFMQSEFGLDRKIFKKNSTSLIDLVRGRPSSASYFFKIENDVFDDWKFPDSPPVSINDRKFLGFYDESVYLNEIVHPFLNEDLKNKDWISMTNKATPTQRIYFDTEIYLEYWRGFIFYEYLSAISEVSLFKEQEVSVYKEIESKYLSDINLIEAFDFLGRVLDFYGIDDHRNFDRFSEAKEASLKSLKKLLEFYKRKKADKVNCLRHYNGYFMFLGKGIYILHSLAYFLGAEEIDLKESNALLYPYGPDLDTGFFIERAKHYSESLWYPRDLSYLDEVEGFWTWVRSFRRLHEAKDHNENFSVLDIDLLDSVIVYLARFETVFVSFIKKSLVDDGSFRVSGDEYKSHKYYLNDFCRPTHRKFDDFYRIVVRESDDSSLASFRASIFKNVEQHKKSLCDSDDEVFIGSYIFIMECRNRVVHYTSLDGYLRNEEELSFIIKDSLVVLNKLLEKSCHKGFLKDE